MDLEAAGSTGGRQVEQQGFQAPLLSPERHILMEEEVITPPRGGYPAPVNQVPPGGVRAVPQIFTGVRPREGGPDHHKDVESPVDRLVDTVARMQMDLAENRMFRTPKVPAGGARWGSSSVGTANPVGSDGPVVAGSPIGPCETLSPLFHDALDR